jgi:hypothetical protein
MGDGMGHSNSGTPSLETLRVNGHFCGVTWDSILLYILNAKDLLCRVSLDLDLHRLVIILKFLSMMASHAVVFGVIEFE